MANKNKRAQQAQKVEKVASASPTPEVKNTETKVDPPKVEEPKVIPPKAQSAPPQKKERIPVVKPQVISADGTSELVAKDAIKLAELNRDAIAMDLLGDTPELTGMLKKQYAVSLVVANVLFQEEIKAAGVDKRLGLVLKDEEVNAFIAAVNELGITGVKQLEVKPADGQTAIDFSEAEVPAPIVEAAKVDKKVAEDPVPELDPEKFESEDDLIKAVRYTATRNFIGQSRKTGRPSTGADLIINCMKLVSLYRLRTADENTKKTLSEKKADYWVNEVFRLLITTETPQLPTRIYSMCKTIYGNASASKTVLPAHAVFMRLAEHTDITDVAAAQIVKSAIAHISLEWLEKNKKSINQLSEDPGQKGIDETTGLMVLKILNRDKLTSKKELDKIGIYRGAAGIFANCAFTKEARELPTFEETFEKKFLEIAALYGAVPNEEDQRALESLCAPIKEDTKKN